MPVMQTLLVFLEIVSILGNIKQHKNSLSDLSENEPMILLMLLEVGGSIELFSMPQLLGGILYPLCNIFPTHDKCKEVFREIFLLPFFNEHIFSKNIYP